MLTLSCLESEWCFDVVSSKLLYQFDSRNRDEETLRASIIKSKNPTLARIVLLSFHAPGWDVARIRCFYYTYTLLVYARNTLYTAQTYGSIRVTPNRFDYHKFFFYLFQHPHQRKFEFLTISRNSRTDYLKKKKTNIKRSIPIGHFDHFSSHLLPRARHSTSKMNSDSRTAKPRCQSLLRSYGKRIFLYFRI